ncbi:MAG: hypothetical protein GXZ15_04925 [Campylobacter sp.]|nr:hypothetical protein [Campylobacter sp.]
MKRLFLFILPLLFMSGCATITGYKGDIEEYQSQIYKNDCNFKKDIKAINAGDDRLYTALKAGFRARACKEYELSNKFFDIAENEYKYNVDLKGIISKTSGGISSTLLNDNALDYSGKFYERGMINLYKALNFASIGDHANARVEFNRALNRQERAKSYYTDEVLAAKEIFDNKESAYNRAQMDKLSIAFDKSLGSYEIYKDFINPFITYMAGLYFALESDKKGSELLKESLLMDPQNRQIKKDFELSKSKFSTPKIWLIYENGVSSSISERRIDVPLYLVNDDIYHVGVALPILTSPKNSFSNLSINGIKSEPISDMDAVIRTEFSKTSPIIVRKETLRAIAKAALQYNASQMEKNSDNNVLTAVFAIYSALTTRADIRHIPVFPKEFQAVNVPNTGIATISDNQGRKLLNIETNRDKNTIIYVKSLTKSYLVYDKIEFNNYKFK